MKNKLIKSALCTLIGSIVFINTYAQIDDLAKVISGSSSDFEKIGEAYLSPFLKGVANATSGGWYNTAKVHKPLGFELTLITNMAFVPDADKSYDVSSLGLEEFTLDDPTMNTAPTILSDGESSASLVTTIGSEDISVKLPDGLVSFPVPMVTPQLGIGIYKGTDLFVRYMPTFSLGSTGIEMGSWGVGVRHSIKQWIPVIEKIPILHLSASLGYTKFSASYALDIEPSTFNTSLPDNSEAGAYEDQELQLEASSFTGNVLVSANLPVVCFFGSVGFVNTSSDFILAGKYPVLSDTGITASESDPVSVSVGKGLKPRASIGMRLKMAVVTLHGEYVVSEYNMVTAGLGITFR